MTIDALEAESAVCGSSWNDNYYYIPLGSSMYICADGKPYLCMRE